MKTAICRFSFQNFLRSFISSQSIVLENIIYQCRLQTLYSFLNEKLHVQHALGMCNQDLSATSFFLLTLKQAKVFLGQDKQATANPLGPSRRLTSVKRVAHTEAVSASPLFIQFRTKPIFHSIEPQEKEIALRLIRMHCAYVLIDMHARRFHVHLPLSISPPCMGHSLMGRSRQLGLVPCQCELCGEKKLDRK